MITDPMTVFAIPNQPEPHYMTMSRDPTFSTWLVRIGGDTGKPLGNLSASWAAVARHVYSKQQPWNSSGTLLSIENRGGTMSPLLLNGRTYLPERGPCSNYDRWDYRWHPSLLHADEQINVNHAGTELMWFDVTRCLKTRSWTLPIVAEYGIGSGEGNVSLDGRYVVVASLTQMVVIDMDPQPPAAPAYPFRRIGPVYTIPACSLSVGIPGPCLVDNVSISPSGRYIDVKYHGMPLDGIPLCDSLCDLHRIFEVDSSLAITPHVMAGEALRCGSFAARPNGWIFPLKHADMALDPFDGNEDVIIGGRACPGSTLGRVVKVRLRDGKVTALTSPANESGYVHGSARNTARPGWFYVTYSRDPSYAGSRFWGEVVAVKLDGSGAVQRFAHYHSTQSVYDSEAQGAPSPDGRRVLIASDWGDHCITPCGSLLTARDYVVDASDTGPLAVPHADVASGLSLEILGQQPSTRGIVVAFTLPDSRSVSLEVFDMLGRRVRRRDLAALGPGVHSLSLDETATLAAGVYFVTLREGGERRSTRAVLVR